MRVLIADKFETTGREALAADGCHVIYEPDAKDDALVQAIGKQRPDVLVVRSTKVNQAMLEAGELKLVVRAGAGYNTIDVAAASRRGIYVANCPGKNSVAVAELAMALILALDRRVADNVIDLRQGKWNKKEYSRAQGLMGRTLGLIGTGQIGREVIARAHAFGMRVCAWSRSLTDDLADELGVVRCEDQLEVARQSDVVSVHLALTPDTRGFIDEAFLNVMREGAMLINTSRGEVVDQQALQRAMQQRGLRAGLDVYANEPAGGSGTFDDEIAKEKNLYGTHHIGASTDQAQEAIAKEAVRIISTFKNSGKVPNVVNLAQRTPATHLLVVRHVDRPGVLAGVLDALRAAQINVQEMENVVFEGSEAAVARIHLEGAPDNSVLAQLRQQNKDIIELSLIELVY